MRKIYPALFCTLITLISSPLYASSENDIVVMLQCPHMEDKRTIKTSLNQPIHFNCEETGCLRNAILNIKSLASYDTLSGSAGVSKADQPLGYEGDLRLGLLHRDSADIKLDEGMNLKAIVKSINANSEKSDVDATMFTDSNKKFRLRLQARKTACPIKVVRDQIKHKTATKTVAPEHIIPNTTKRNHDQLAAKLTLDHQSLSIFDTNMFEFAGVKFHLLWKTEWDAKYEKKSSVE